MRQGTFLFALMLSVVFSAPSVGDESPGGTLDAFHAAAAEAKEQVYLAQLTPEMVFLGTDGNERWQGQAFRDFVHENFSAGRGWVYRSSQREIRLSDEGQVAWFDEALQHDQLGHCRGSGVLELVDGDWKIAQYNLSVPIPNEMVMSVVSEIQEAPAADKAPAADSKCRKKRHKTNTKAGC